MKSQSCERPCLCHENLEQTQFVILTGGPGAGKTAVLEFVKKIFCEHVAILPEAASILFGGGFWRLDSDSAKQASQRAIYHVQNEMQILVAAEKKWSLGLCDRGTLDGLAYWPGRPEDYFSSLNTSLQNEFLKYRAVIHLRTPTIEQGYNYQNPIRVESAELAAIIDDRIHEIWCKHPNYCLIESTDNFMEKVYKSTHVIESHIPACCRRQIRTAVF